MIPPSSTSCGTSAADSAALSTPIWSSAAITATEPGWLSARAPACTTAAGRRAAATAVTASDPGSWRTELAGASPGAISGSSWLAKSRICRGTR